MKRKQHSEEQIAFALRQHEAGTSVPDIIRKIGISKQAFYRETLPYMGIFAVQGYDKQPDGDFKSQLLIRH